MTILHHCMHCKELACIFFPQIVSHNSLNNIIDLIVILLGGGHVGEVKGEGQQMNVQCICNHKQSISMQIPLNGG